MVSFLRISRSVSRMVVCGSVIVWPFLHWRSTYTRAAPRDSPRRPEYSTIDCVYIGLSNDRGGAGGAGARWHRYVGPATHGGAGAVHRRGSARTRACPTMHI